MHFSGLGQEGCKSSCLTISVFGVSAFSCELILRFFCTSPMGVLSFTYTLALATVSLFLVFLTALPGLLGFVVSFSISSLGSALMSPSPCFTICALSQISCKALFTSRSLLCHVALALPPPLSQVFALGARDLEELSVFYSTPLLTLRLYYSLICACSVVSLYTFINRNLLLASIIKVAGTSQQQRQQPVVSLTSHFCKGLILRTWFWLLSH